MIFAKMPTEKEISTNETLNTSLSPVRIFITNSIRIEVMPECHRNFFVFWFRDWKIMLDLAGGTTVYLVLDSDEEAWQGFLSLAGYSGWITESNPERNALALWWSFTYSEGSFWRKTSKDCCIKNGFVNSQKARNTRGYRYIFLHSKTLIFLEQLDFLCYTGIII